MKLPKYVRHVWKSFFDQLSKGGIQNLIFWHLALELASVPTNPNARFLDPEFRPLFLDYKGKNSMPKKNIEKKLAQTYFIETRTIFAHVLQVLGPVCAQESKEDP
jgi:hypothetical protein